MKKEILKRAFFGLIYIAIMYIGISFSKLSFTLLFIIILFLCLYEISKLSIGKTKILALLYILIPLILVHFLIDETNSTKNYFNSKIVLLTFILTWTFDTFAYLIGSQFGKHKMLPLISPKKSWEGLLGGGVFTILAAFFLAQYSNIGKVQIEQFNLYFFASILPLTATTGDFIASYFKRKAKVKDSGNLIPGHGGILDRMDAFTITIPVLYIYLNLI